MARRFDGPSLARQRRSLSRAHVVYTPRARVVHHPISHPAHRHVKYANTTFGVRAHRHEIRPACIQKYLQRPAAQSHPTWASPRTLSAHPPSARTQVAPTCRPHAQCMQRRRRRRRRRVHSACGRVYRRSLLRRFVLSLRRHRVVLGVGVELLHLEAVELLGVLAAVV